MDKSGIENPSKSEVIGRCGGMKKRKTTQNRQKSNAKKINNKNQSMINFYDLLDQYM